jgi:hypothetical protein
MTYLSNSRRQPRTLQDFADIASAHGQKAFETRFKGAVLVGLGLAGRVSERPMAWRRRTLTPQDQDQLSAAASVVNRVWRITKSDNGARQAGVSLGQSAENDIVVPEYTVSSQHCTFNYDRFGTTVTDLGSLNGTVVENESIAPHKPVALRDGMVLTLGRLKVRYLTAASFSKLVAEQSSAAA